MKRKHVHLEEPPSSIPPENACSEKDPKKRRIDLMLSENFPFIQFKNYYDLQKVPVDYSYLNKPLPVTFRLNLTLSLPVLSSIHNTLNDHFDKISNLKIDYTQYKINKLQSRLTSLSVKSERNLTGVMNKLEREIHTLQIHEHEYIPRPYLKDKYLRAYQFTTTRTDFHKIADLAFFYKYISLMTSIGVISRQEYVSMLPVILFDINSDSKILDLCASPGSKTKQLIERLEWAKKNGQGTGFVIANDVDRDRLNTLNHNLQLLGSVMKNIVLVRSDAVKMAHIEGVMFDCVLADVFCSSDGTSRKCDVLNNWRADKNWTLHSNQILAVMKAYERLQYGGQLVYSTCSLNPLENEAVVAQILRNCPDLKLVDCKKKLNEAGTKIICDKGMNYWKVINEKGEEIPQYVKGVRNMVPSMFPPTDLEVKKFHLDKCCRILHHHQDTGGFFMSLFHRDKRNQVTDNINIEEKVNKINKGRGFYPTYVLLKSETLNNISEFYGIDKEELNKVLVVRYDYQAMRMKEKNKNVVLREKQIYCVDSGIRKLLEINNKTKTYQVVHAGCKVFSFKKFKISKTNYRMTVDGSVIFHKLMKKRVVYFDVKSFEMFLSAKRHEDIMPYAFQNKELSKALADLSPGSFIAKVSDDVFCLAFKKGNSAKRDIDKGVTELTKVKLRLYHPL